MKRLPFIVALLFIAFGCAAQDAVYYESTPTLAWDPVTADANGDPFLPTDSVEYEIYLWDMAGGDPTAQPISAFTLFAVTSDSSVQLSFDYRAEWACVLRTRLTDGGGNTVYSAPAYTTVEEDTASGPFVYSPVLTWVPRAPAALRDSGM